jgi:hypothetical protein
MDVIFRLKWQIVVHDVRHAVNVDAARGNVCGDQDAMFAFFKFSESLLSLILRTIRMDERRVVDVTAVQLPPETSRKIL